MQVVSRAYKNSIRQIGRNRGYIKISIGVVNKEAQKSIGIDTDKTELTYFADAKVRDAKKVSQIYATTEQNFTRIDSNYYFLPPQDSGAIYYPNGVVTKDILGWVTFDFGKHTDLDIKGLTIDFSDCYPTEFYIADSKKIRHYTNDSRYFRTEDTFNDTSFIRIQPLKMVGGADRLRVYEISCGIANIFTNNELINYSNTEYVSAICDSVPSNDVRISVDNSSLYYCPDNPDSALSYMEIGQEVQVSFGYDTNDDGNIEWLPPQTSYLQTWSADKEQADFTATDRFDNMSSVYYKGKVREEGISLYDLAVLVLEDAGIDNYFIDSYLKEIITYNPIPPVEHSSALQIIANAGRCSLSEDRQGRIHIQSNFIPKVTAHSDDETWYSQAENVVDSAFIHHYAEKSQNYTSVDNTMYFLPTENLLTTGYVSDEVADERGAFTNIPKLVIELEASYSPYSFAIIFCNGYARRIRLHLYADGQIVDVIETNNDSEEFVYDEQLPTFDRMEIEFMQGVPNSRVFVDNVSLGMQSDYYLQDNYELNDSPASTRQTKLQSVEMVRTLYTRDMDEVTSISTETVVLDASHPTYTAYLNSASYDLSVEVATEGVTAVITEQSNYYATLQFSGVTKEMDVEFSIIGKIYDVKEITYPMTFNEKGEIITWNNPLISELEHAKMVGQWIADYYIGDVEYEIDWRGDPRVDANDIFYMDNVLKEKVQVRAYQNTLNFSNAGWSGTMKARKIYE